MAFYVERPEDVAEAMAEALASDVVSVVEIPIDPDELPYPGARRRRVQVPAAAEAGREENAGPNR